LRGLFLCLLYRFKDILSQPFLPNRAVVALDAGALLRVSVNRPEFTGGHQLK
jgi:hypothetical protein